MKYLIFLVASICVLACTNHQPAVEKGKVKQSEVQYAKGFAMEVRQGKTYIDVYNPWNNNSILKSYVLTSGNEVSDGELQVPLQKITCLSSTYLGMIAMLNERDKVIATSNANWICDSMLFQRFIDGDITNLGNDMSISAEAVIVDQPNAVIKYIYQSPDPVDPVIEGSGIPLVYVIEFMEQHPLGRAEWIKVLGALLGKKQEADSIFNGIVEQYNAHLNLAATVAEKPTVLCGSIYKGTWYAAGGQSYIAQMLRDANASYFWEADTSTGSLSLAFETIIKNQKDADFWINANAFTLNELIAIEARSNVFKAFENGEVYHYNKRLNANGGLDYYETGVVRPDLLLKDLLIILHPGLIEGETVYYNKLQ